MSTLTSSEILDATVRMGASKAGQSPLSRAANTFLAGMYIAIGGFLAIRVGLTLPWETWGGFGKFMFGAVFPLGLMLVVLCGADLFTGSCMTLTTARAQNQITLGQALFTGASSWIGNFAGALFVAYFIAYLSGLIFDAAGGTLPYASAAVNLANAKCSLGFTEAFLRGVGCNWLVCLAVFAAAASTETAGQDRRSVVPDDGVRRSWHGALHCQYVFYSPGHSHRLRPSLHSACRSRKSSAA